MELPDTKGFHYSLDGSPFIEIDLTRGTMKFTLASDGAPFVAAALLALLFRRTLQMRFGTRTVM